MPGPGRTIRALAAVAIPLCAFGAQALTPASAAGPQTFAVSSHGSDTNPCTNSAPCATITRAVSLAPAGATVKVWQGTYHESVMITRALKLVGVNHPTIDASSLNNGIVISGTAAAWTSVSGFTVKDAIAEGILALRTHHVTIQSNVVKDNDRGIFLPAKQQTGECMAQGPIPGDCGEGLHLMTVTDARVRNNWVSGNAGGILLSDEFGVTTRNIVARNQVLNNLYDCGITVVGHRPMSAGGGVYDNIVTHNVASGNGTRGQGGGILLAVGAPGGGVYDNMILFNVARYNGLAGVTIHNHGIPGPPADIDGNVIVGNTLEHNALDGWGPGQPGDNDTTDHQQTGILIASAAPVAGTQVWGNHISDAYYGIWTQNVPPISPDTNDFVDDVTVPVFQQ